jgi:hypothetical protein
MLQGFCVTAAATRAGLTRLDLSAPGSRRDEALTDAGIGALAPLGALRSLSLAGHAELTAEGLSFLSACTALTALDLSGAPLHASCDTDATWSAAS